VESNATAGIDPAPIAPPHGRLHLDKTVGLPNHDTDGVEDALSVVPAREMDNDAQPGTKLTVRGFAGQPRGGAQCLDPGGHIDH
jgi:hypothetical protein